MLSQAALHSEWLAVRRHPLVWITFALGLGFIAVAVGNENPRDLRDALEAQRQLGLLIPAFVLPFLAGALAPVFYLREVEHGLGELFAAFPQPAGAWLRSRFGALAVLLALIALGQQLVITALLAMAIPAALGPLATQGAWLLAVVQLPACLIWAALLARVSTASGKARLVYLAAAFGWLAYIGLATLSGTPLIAGSFVAAQPLHTAMIWADPYAVTALTSQHLPLPLALVLAVNRLGWLALCLIVLRQARQIPALIPARPASQRRPSRLASRPGPLPLLLRWTLRDHFILLAMLGWAVLVFPEVFGGMHHAEQLAVLLPDSRDALNRVMWDMVPPFGALLLLYCADRAGRMNSLTGMAEIAAATPRPAWRTLAAQIAALWLVALLMLAFTLLVVLAAQLAAQSPFQPAEYFAQAALALLGLLLAASLFAALHAAIPSRLAVNLIGFAAIVLGHSSLAPAMGLMHPLWRPLALPLSPPDHLLGLAPSRAAMLPYALFWTALSAALLVLAVRLNRRGVPYAQTRPARTLAHPASLLLAALLALAAGQGQAIHRALAADGALTSADERAMLRAAYEQRYGPWLGRPQPEVRSVKAHFTFASEGTGVALKAELTLTNPGPGLIQQVLISRGPLDPGAAITLPGARTLADDRAAGAIRFDLAQPMRAGETRTLLVEARITRSPLSTDQGLLILQPGFGAVPAFQILPQIGFQRTFTLRDPATRARFGLPPLALTPPSALDLGSEAISAQQARIETLISLPIGRHAAAPGERIRAWRAGGQDHVLFRTDRPIRNLPMVFNLPWPAQHFSVGPLDAEIFAPQAIAADDPNLLGMADTMAWLHRTVAPYPGQSLRLIAAPPFGSSGYAVPQAMLISHRRGFRTRPAPGAGFNQAYRRAVHETAHQWFGHLLGYGRAEERAFLVESLAKYAELAMIEARYGKAAMAALVAWEADRFASARLLPGESATPLIDAEDTEDMYSRATLVFACLRTRIGDAPILAALSALAQETARTGRPQGARQFVTALKAASPAAAHGAIDRLLTSPVPIGPALAQSGCQAPE